MFGRVQWQESGATATVRGIFGKESPPCLERERPRPRTERSKVRRALRIPAFARCCPVLGVGERCEIAFSEGSPRHGGGFLPAAPVFVAEGIVWRQAWRRLAACGGARRQAWRRPAMPTAISSSVSHWGISSLESLVVETDDSRKWPYSYTGAPPPLHHFTGRDQKPATCFRR